MNAVYNPTEYWLDRGVYYHQEKRLDAPYYREQEAFIVDIVKFLKASNILSSGCGFGRVELATAKAIPEVFIVGMDISEEQLAVARTRCAGTKTRFYHGDLMTGRLPEGEFDLAMAIEVLLHLPSIEAVVEKLLTAAPVLMHELDDTAVPGEPTAPHCFNHDYIGIYRRMGLDVTVKRTPGQALVLVSR